MAENASIFRPQTPAEKLDFEHLDRNSKRKRPEMVIKAEVEKHESRATKQHIPFCRRCAKMDLLDKYENVLKEYQRSGKVADMKGLNVDFDTYADIKRFTLLDSSPAKEKTIIGTTSVMADIGTHYNFQCNVRRCGISVFVPKDETPSWEKTKSKEK